MVVICAVAIIDRNSVSLPGRFLSTVAFVSRGRWSVNVREQARSSPQARTMYGLFSFEIHNVVQGNPLG